VWTVVVEDEDSCVTRQAGSDTEHTSNPLAAVEEEEAVVGGGTGGPDGREVVLRGALTRPRGPWTGVEAWPPPLRL
jgi:hypothetical protein